MEKKKIKGIVIETDTNNFENPTKMTFFLTVGTFEKGLHNKVGDQFITNSRIIDAINAYNTPEGSVIGKFVADIDHEKKAIVIDDYYPTHKIGYQKIGIASFALFRTTEKLRKMFPGFNLRIAKGARTPGQIHFAKMGLSEDEIPLKEASRRIRS